MSFQFDQNLQQQVDQFLGDVDDFITNKNGSAVEKLIGLLGSEEKSIQYNSMAMLAFANQAPNNKDVSRENGLLKIFLDYCHPSKIITVLPMVKNASMGLMFLANHSDVNKQAIADLNGIDTIFELLRDLLVMIKSPPEDVKKEDIVSTLSQTLNLVIILASLQGNREKMGTVANFLVLNSLLSYENPSSLDLQLQIQEKALSATNNICIHKENKENCRVAGVVESVFKLFYSTKPSIQDGALRMIYNMTIVDASREAIRRCKGLETLVSMLKDQPEAVSLLSLKALSNMFVDRQTIEYSVNNQDAILVPIYNVFPPAYGQGCSDNLLDQVLTVVQNLVSEENLIENVARSGIITKIVPAVKGMPLTNTTHQSILVKASCILSGLITIEEVQQAAVENGLITLLVEMIQLPSAEVRRECARALANATPYYDDVRAEIGKQGGVKLCVELLLQSDKELVKQAARSLVNLARNTHNEEALFESKGLEHSIRLINLPEKDLKMLGTKLLVNLSLNEAARIAFCQKGGLSIVTTLLVSQDPELQLQGTKIATNLAISGRNRKIMNEQAPELIPSLKALASSAVADIKLQSEVALNNLSFPYEQSYEGLDQMEDAMPIFMQSQYERDDEDEEDDDEEADARKRQEEEEIRIAAEKEVEERKRIMQEEVKRIEERRRQEQEKRVQEEQARKQREEEAEKLRKAQEEMEKLRIEEEAKEKAEQERKRIEEQKEKERLEQERIKLLDEQQKQKEAEESKRREAEAKAQEEERVRKQKEEEERIRKQKEEEERIKKEKEAEAERLRLEEEERLKKEREVEEARMRALEEEQLRKMEAEIKQREEDIRRQKIEEEERRKREEQERKLKDQQDKASQESARLAQEASRAQKRTHIVQEIMQVEVNYVKNLLLIVRKFLQPLNQIATSKRPVVTAERIAQIFSTIENIQNHNAIFSDGLTSRIKRWLADNKKDHLIIGDIFQKIGGFMNDYSKYINNYNNSIKLYNETRKANPQFAAFIKKVESDPELNDKELENLLITPVQQLPRYIMLVQDLIRNTSEDHPDFKPLTEALEKIKHITTIINEKKRDAEDAFAMLQIHQTLHGKVPNNFVAPHRKFIREGAIHFGSSSGSFKDKEPIVFLFNDMVMMTIKHPNRPNEYKYRYSTFLTPSTTIEDLPSVNNGFIIKSGQWWSFSCPTPKDKENWVEAIKKSLANLPKEALKAQTPSKK
ncbi:hypothetical protein DICPUDRAFT_156926 [Dictyostelium purpureum]|uniref:DH domain-containing protein n=1 Tax=Dictyostelium purpureum TaxID=5786 RepID=F0ZXT4_DICPU|nr:uncharacterized protein DICPUDRAFT_156926 [Dictyostelium purpureum]EGC31252.1 hypothetical protein DICPUDRAFT_156926 [Dictyostelium purpureum]|eukprot:XP_003292230.1 hypothetical protein DICPUDRAFT_156926 [Dictyostelium purpureum]